MKSTLFCIAGIILILTAIIGGFGWEIFSIVWIIKELMVVSNQAVISAWDIVFPVMWFVCRSLVTIPIVFVSGFLGWCCFAYAGFEWAKR